MSDLRRPLVALVALAVLCTVVGVFLFPGPPDHRQPPGTSSIENLGSVAPQTPQATPAVQPVAAAAPASDPASVGAAGQGGNATHPLTKDPSNSTAATTRPADTAPADTTTTTGAPAVAANNCGGSAPYVPTNPTTGQSWKCTFDDEFTGTSLDRSKWLVQTTAVSGYTAGDDCYMDSPNNVSVSGGVLSLTAVHEAAPVSCGSYESYNTSGEVMTYKTFSQTYGFFEVRAKFPDVTVPGLQSTLWLWPVSTAKYPLQGQAGEIDFAEWFSQSPYFDIPNVHYLGASSTDTTQCPLPNPATFHTYGLEWTPSSLTIFLDGTTCLVDTWHPLLLTPPSPFDQPFFLNLTQALGQGTNSFNPATTPMPATTQVDWVRVWG